MNSLTFLSVGNYLLLSLVQNKFIDTLGLAKENEWDQGIAGIE